MPPKLIVITIAESGSICPSHLARRGRRRPTLLTVRAVLSASEVSAPPYGRREPRRDSHNQQTHSGYGSEQTGRERNAGSESGRERQGECRPSLKRNGDAARPLAVQPCKIGRASCRERV